MANNGYDRDLATKAVGSGDVDLIAFGRPFIANPELVERLTQNANLNEIDAARDTPTPDSYPLSFNGRKLANR